MTQVEGHPTERICDDEVNMSFLFRNGFRVNAGDIFTSKDPMLEAL